jgi:hypothetical protein
VTDEQGTTATATDAGEGATPAQATTAQAAAPPATGTDALGDGGKAALEAERTARRDAENRAKKAERERDELKRAGMTDLEAAQTRVKELEANEAATAAEKVDMRIRMSALEAATTLKFRNPALAHRLLDRSEVKFEEDGVTPRNVETLLKKIAEAEPYLVQGASQDFGGGARGKTPGQGPDMDALLRAAARGG